LKYPIISFKLLVNARRIYRLSVEVEWYGDHSTVVSLFIYIIVRGLLRIVNLRSGKALREKQRIIGWKGWGV
jgi:hypothetical protein